MVFVSNCAAKVCPIVSCHTYFNTHVVSEAKVYRCLVPSPEPVSCLYYHHNLSSNLFKLSSKAIMHCLTLGIYSFMSRRLEPPRQMSKNLQLW